MSTQISSVVISNDTELKTNLNTTIYDVLVANSTTDPNSGIESSTWSPMALSTLIPLVPQTLLGDVTGTTAASVVSLVGGSTGTAVGTATVLANNATASNTASTIVKRDSSGAFTTTTIYGGTAIASQLSTVELFVSHDVASSGGIAIQKSNDGTNSPNLTLRKTRGTTAAPTIAVTEDSVGHIIFQAYNGTAIASCASIMANIEGIVSATATPGRILFQTSGAGTSALVERMRIDSDGNVGIGGTADANAILDVQSTTKAFKPPRMTSTQKNNIASPTSGMVVYDSTLNKLSVYGAASWETITSV